MNNLKVYTSIKDAYRYARQNDSRMTDKLIEYYKEGQSNPSVAKIIDNDGFHSYINSYSNMIIEDISRGRNKKEAITEFGENSNNMIENMTKLKQAPEVAPYKQAFDKQMETLYPKTYFLRDSIVLNNRISFADEHPKPKAGFLEKLKLKLIANLKKKSQG